MKQTCISSIFWGIKTKKKNFFLATPAWYAYGEMFYSLFLISKLASYYNISPVLLYPTAHLRKKTQLHAITNHELKQFILSDFGLVGNPKALLVRIVSAYITLSRKYRHTLLGRLIRKLSSDRLLRPKLGFYGHKGFEDLRKMLGLEEPVDWPSVLIHPTRIDFLPEQQKRAKRKFAALGIGDEPFVCLYVRDANYVKNRVSTPIFNFYLADIQSYLPAIEALVSKGFKVVRMGDPSAAPLPSMKGVIDYVHTEHYHPLLDLYLFRNCRFMLTTGGGVRQAALLYGKDTVVTNWTPLHLSGYCIHEGDRFIAKHVYSKRQKRLLSLREQLSLINEATDRWGFFDPEHFVLVDNDPQEIKNAVINYLDGKLDEDFDGCDSLQDAYSDLRQEQTRIRNDRFLKKNGFESHSEMFDHFRPRLDRDFLQNCWEYGPYLEKLTERFRRNHVDPADKA